MKHFLTNKTLPFWLFTISAILILTISQLVQDGVFMDGMLYISVSKNLADGLGTFWEPHFSKTVMSTFREQPPLYFGLLACFYKVFGTSMYVERLFCFICYFLTLLFIHKIWKSIFKTNIEISKHSWLPILFFATIPVCFWAYANHVEETVMTLFATMSVYYLCKAFFENEKIILNVILAGVCVFLSSLTKGIQGMFPIAAIFLFWLVKKDFTFKKNVMYSCVLVLTPIIIYVLLILSNNHILEVLKLYLENRLGNSFNSPERSSAGYRFEIIIRLFSELIPAMVILTIILFLGRKLSNNFFIKKQDLHKLLWFILVGLSGTLPLMITLEQRGFYLLTALPLFSVAFAIVGVNSISYITKKMDNTLKIFITLKWVAFILFIFSIAITVFKFDKFKRDKEMLADVYQLGKIIPKGEIISIPLEMASTWNFHTYMIRYNYISIDVSQNKNHYFAIEKKLPSTLVPSNYERFPIKTEYLDLYINKDTK